MVGFVFEMVSSSSKTNVMADNNKRERDQRQETGSRKEQKTSGEKNQKRGNNKESNNEGRSEEKEQKNDRRR